jgi:hypothetical protein
MRLCLRRLRLAVPALVVVGVLVEAAVGAGPPYNDPVGDTSAADVQWVTVTNSATGLLSFRIKLNNRGSVQPNDRMFLYLNTDRKSSTGDTYAPRDKHGADYYVYLTGKTKKYIVARLTGNKSTLLPRGTSKSDCCLSGQWTFSINAKEIGNPKAFDFYVHTKYQDPAKKRFDYAPTKGLYSYQLTGG